MFDFILKREPLKALRSRLPERFDPLKNSLTDHLWQYLDSYIQSSTKLLI